MLICGQDIPCLNMNFNIDIIHVKCKAFSLAICTIPWDAQIDVRWFDVVFGLGWVGFALGCSLGGLSPVTGQPWHGMFLYLVALNIFVLFSDSMATLSSCGTIISPLPYNWRLIHVIFHCPCVIVPNSGMSSSGLADIRSELLAAFVGGVGVGSWFGCGVWFWGL